jgi:hypothetical protein
VARRVRHLLDGSAVGEIGVHDPFELIRHLARSQSDPRKAVAELVQNALDEQASHVVIERRRDEGDTMLSILDDGHGVLPQLERKDALTAIAKNIGHSRKRQLSFDERMRQAMLGQYGIGLLGFWAIGHEMRILSRVAESEVWSLTLFEDSPRYTIARVPDVIGREPTWTEVQVRRLHRSAIVPTTGNRLATYLSIELRGQLVRHGTELRLVDRLGRGGSEKATVITPSQLAGERLPGLDPIRVADYPYPIEIILHYAGDAGPNSGRVRLACAGAIVLDDIAQVPELAHAPWDDQRLVGVIDFPHLEVPPGSRRGIVPNAAASALLNALVRIEATVIAKLDDRAQAESASLSEDMHKQLARLFTRVTGYVPHLEWFPVARRSGAVEGAPSAGTAVSAEIDADTETEDGTSRQPELFAAGPLHSVAIRPAKIELAVGDQRVLHASARDAEDKVLREGVNYSWTTSSDSLSLSPEAGRVVVVAQAPVEEAAVYVTARHDSIERTSAACVHVVAERERRSDAGIPQPEEINEPLQSWRSRLVGDTWQINVGHADYRALSAEQRPRLRYLSTLLSKEIVTRNFPQPGLGAILEELVGLLAALERSGAWGGKVRE